MLIILRFLSDKHLLDGFNWKICTSCPAGTVANVNKLFYVPLEVISMTESHLVRIPDTSLLGL
jgi:hypothetical protein